MATVNSGQSLTFPAGELTYSSGLTVDGELLAAGETQLADADGDPAPMSGTATLFGTSPQGDPFLVAAGETFTVPGSERTFIGTNGTDINGTLDVSGTLNIGDASVYWSALGELIGRGELFATVPIRRRDTASIDYEQERDEYALADTDPA